MTCSAFLDRMENTMLYYRYRPMTSLTIKELIYDELYFSYPEELNDPLDGMITYEFSEDFPKWKRLLERAWDGLEVDATKFAEGFARSAPITMGELIENPQFILSKILEFIDTKNIMLAPILAEKLKAYISIYKPNHGCSVSFSRTYENALMWSHYTGKHEGFCLIFRSLNGKINQCPSRRKTFVDIEDHCKLSVTENFKLHDITYGPKQSIDGFTLFPHSVYGRDMTDHERKIYWERTENSTLTKSSYWNYEQESRLYIPANSSCVSNESISSINRIFHYDNSQIAGVIYGIRMSESNKKLVREVLLKKSRERHLDSSNEKYLFDIVSFESKFDDNQHNISIKPSEIFDCGSAISSSNPAFISKLSSWEKGEAIHIRPTEKGTSGSRIILE